MKWSLQTPRTASAESQPGIKANFRFILGNSSLLNLGQSLPSTKMEKSEFFLKMESFPRLIKTWTFCSVGLFWEGTCSRKLCILLSPQDGTALGRPGLLLGALLPPDSWWCALHRRRVPHLSTGHEGAVKPHQGQWWRVRGHPASSACQAGLSSPSLSVCQRPHLSLDSPPDR